MKKAALLLCISLLAVFLASGCAHLQRVGPDERPVAYKSVDMHENGVFGEYGDMVKDFCPIFLAYKIEAEHNRIGRPEAEMGEDGKERVFVNPDRPAVYAMVKTFATAKGSYTNLIYRIHWSEVVPSLIPFHLTSGKNVGLIVIITLNSKQQPVLISTANTCGCYLSVTPTTFLDKDAFPKGWPEGRQSVFGEMLPAILDFNPETEEKASLAIAMRPALHRVMDIFTTGSDSFEKLAKEIIPMPVHPMESLWSLPVNGSTTPFYETGGRRKGFVKESIKPWE
ncbi:MAG: hypothetical protein QMD09_10330, partial [Desulfatibacillaceae bacterium]|nr:hypothetical protein [Desulfatibacillaceae bacterium]